MKKILLWLWQLPQNLAGLSLIKLLGANHRFYKTDHGFIEWYYFERKGKFSNYISGVSLGRYIILPYENDNTIKHEHGHCIQSQRWGWLYLLAIGLPSLVNNLWDRYMHKDWTREDRQKWYYLRYPEKQADKLGGVERFKEVNNAGTN